MWECDKDKNVENNNKDDIKKPGRLEKNNSHKDEWMRG